MYLQVVTVRNRIKSRISKVMVREHRSLRDSIKTYMSPIGSFYTCMWSQGDDSSDSNPRDVLERIFKMMDKVNHPKLRRPRIKYSRTDGRM